MGAMRKKILRRRGQAGAVSTLMAAVFAAALAPGCVDLENDGPEGTDAALPGAEAGLAEGGSGVITNEAGVATDGSVAPTGDAAQSAVDASSPRDATTTPGDATTTPVDAAMDARVDTGTPAVDAGPNGPNPEPGRLAGITAAHNAARARVPTDKPLPPLTWSTDIAKVAQAYADKLASTCSTTLVHSTPQERMGWGENLAMMGGFGSAPAGSAQQAVDLWESELKCYTFGAFQAGVGATCTSACQMYGGCGHYTQVVWRKTLRVGCGVGECTSGSSKRAFWVCNYDPPGNYLGQLPY